MLVPGVYRLFTDGLWSSVQSISDGSRNIMNTDFTVEATRNLQIVVTLQP